MNIDQNGSCSTFAKIRLDKSLFLHFVSFIGCTQGSNRAPLLQSAGVAITRLENVTKRMYQLGDWTRSMVLHLPNAVTHLIEFLILG